MNADPAAIHEAFDKLRAHGVDVGSPLRWSFYFANPTEPPLHEVVRELDGFDYVVEHLAPNDQGLWILKVSKTEILPPDKLHRRNVSFNELAQYCGVDVYDGWEVAVKPVKLAAPDA